MSLMGLGSLQGQCALLFVLQCILLELMFTLCI